MEEEVVVVRLCFQVELIANGLHLGPPFSL